MKGPLIHMKHLWRLFVFIAFIAGVLLFAQTMAPQRSHLISSDYFQLRANFLDRARERSAKIFSRPLEARGPNGEELFVDFAWLGTEKPRDVLIHICGTHGVEGYAGSAIQSTVLHKGFEIPPDSAVLFVHGVNAWGMAHRRRFNEANVDLNRNFLLDNEAFKGAPEGYHLVESFLNPSGMPQRIDFFYPEAVINVLRHGYNALKQAIAGGQYEYEKGIYFGGKELQPGLKILREFFTQHLSEVRSAYVIEIHSGLGDWAKDVIFWPLSLKDPKSRWLMEKTSQQLASDAPEEGVGFRTPGDLQNEVPKILPKTDFYWVLQEFGAYGAMRTLKVLRDENRYHQSGGSDVNHWSKQMLLEIFTPGAADWQQRVLARGEELFERFRSLLGSKPLPPPA